MNDILRGWLLKIDRLLADVRKQRSEAYGDPESEWFVPCADEWTVQLEAMRKEISDCIHE